MSEHPPGRIWSGIDMVKVIAGTLAAVSAAVIGSFLGVAGTLGGAAVASLIGGLGTEVYAKSLQHGVSKIKGQPGQPPVTTPEAVDAPAEPKPPTGDRTRGYVDPVAQDGAVKPRRPRWQLVALPALVFFVLAMGALFAIESIAGKSVPSMVGKQTSRSTTLGTAVGAGKKAQPTEAPDTQKSQGPEEKEPAGGLTGRKRRTHPPLEYPHLPHLKHPHRPGAAAAAAAAADENDELNEALDRLSDLCGRRSRASPHQPR